MNSADRDASIFELVLRTIAETRKDIPDYQGTVDGLIPLNEMLAKAIKAFTSDERYNNYIFVLMLAGLCHKYLYDLMPDNDITTALMESSFYGDRAHANRQSTLQRNKSDIQSERNTDN